MGLHDLVHDGQSQARAAFKLRLEWLKDFFGKVGWDARACIANSDAQEISRGAYRDGNRPLALHRAHSVLKQVPEHLFDSVSVHGSIGVGHGIVAHNSELL